MSNPPNNPALGNLAPGDLTAHWKSIRPRVSILLATYNQVEFIDIAIASILGQRTSFPFEVIIRDDFSNDGTQDRLESWRRMYPDVIRLKLEVENTFINVGAFDAMIDMAQGEYIISAEGDDYWTDERKIEKQATALDDDEGAVAAFHRVLQLDQATGRVIQPPRSIAKTLSSSDWLADLSVPVQSLMFRNIVGARPRKYPRIVNGDTYLQSRLAIHGKALFISDLLPSIYRIHDRGIWSSADSRSKAIAQCESFYWIACELCDEGRISEARVILAMSAQAIVESHIDRGLDPRRIVSLRNGWVARILSKLSGNFPTVRGLSRRLRRFVVRHL